jgi:prepilin-type N-terminal cleavage/methylation domain-containing protein
MDKRLGQSGFSLMEIMIALTIFSVFIIVFLSNQSYNISDSIQMAEEVKVHHLCQSKLNEIFLDPPDFTDSLDGKKETKTFKIKGYEGYSYRILYKKLKLPSFDKLAPPSEDLQKGQSAQEKMVMEKLKENIEKVVWQVEVTIINKETEYEYTLSTWIQNLKAEVDLNLGF